MERVLEAALKSGAEGIHPGYGFLSENPQFVDLCEKNGVKFIGPSSDAMKKMASKTIRYTPILKDSSRSF